jgi:hypothetical protein
MDLKHYIVEAKITHVVKAENEEVAKDYVAELIEDDYFDGSDYEFETTELSV